MAPLPSNIDSGTKKPCGACRVRRCRCDSRCVFASVISYDEPHKYRALNELYNIKWVEEVLSEFPDRSMSRADVVEVLLAKDTGFKAWLTRYVPSAFKTEGGGTKRRSQPCGACKEKKRECNPSCVFAGGIPYQEPQKYRTLKKVFNIKQLEERLRPLNDEQRVEVVNLFLTEAERLIKEFSPGSGNHISPDLAAQPQYVLQQDLGPMDNYNILANIMSPPMDNYNILANIMSPPMDNYNILANILSPPLPTDVAAGFRSF